MENSKILFVVFLMSLLCLSLANSAEYTLRPEADGTTALTPVSCTNNYECVDEASANDDTDYVRTSGVQVYQYDLYDLPAHAGGASDTINNVTIYYRVRCENAGGSVCKFKSYMRTESTNYEGSEKLSSGDSYINYNEFYDDNPNTGTEWTINQINALQAGIGLNGFLNSDGNRARGTQVYVVVGYTPAVEPNITFVSPTPNNDTYINTNWTYINATSDIDVDVATLEFNGTNYTMTKVSNTSFYYNVTPLDDCANYTYKIYANSTGAGLVGESEERVVKVSQTDPVINWYVPPSVGLTYYDDFYINATVLNCNLSDINLSIYNFSGEKYYFKQIDPLGASSYDIYELTNFTTSQDPIEISNIEICAQNDGGLSTCENRSFIYNSNFSSPQHSSLKVDDFTFSSSTYQTILNQSFNQSQVNNATFRSSFYAEKINTPGQNNDIYVKYILNGVDLCDESIITLTGVNIYRSATTCISEGEIQVGENNIVIQIRRTNNGDINVYNWQLHFENGQTNLLTDFRRDVNIVNGTISSTTFQPVLNFTTEKRTNSTTIIDSSMTITTNAAATVECYGSNGIENGSTLIRSTSGAGESMSIGGIFKTSIPVTVSETWTLYCKQDVSTSTIDLEAYTEDTLDDGNRTMHSDFVRNKSINITNPLNLTSGKTLILNLTNYMVMSSDGIDLVAVVNAESLSGSQDINISIEAQSNSSSYLTFHLRSFSDTGEDSNIKIYGEFENISVGTYANISIYANVDTGDSFAIKGVSLLARDVSTLDTETSNVAPIVVLDYPENGTTQWYDEQNINFTLIDFNGNLDYCNITLNDTVVNDNTTENIKINYTDYSYGYYSLNIICYDELGLNDTDNAFITLACTENWIPSVSTCSNSQRTLTYTDSNSCTTTFDLPADNGTTQACTDINMEIIQNYITKDLIIGKDFSFMGNLFSINSTLSITNSLCTFSSYINNSDNDTVLLDSQKYVTSGDGYIYYNVNTNNWQKYTKFDAVEKTGYLNINCYCRTDCTDSSEEGCCILANGSLTTDYKYVTETVSFNVIEDESVFPFENIGLIMAVGLFAFLLLYVAFKMEDKHFILQLFLLITSIISLFLLSTININATNGRAFTFLKLTLWTVRIFFFYVTGYFIYEIMKWKGIIGGKGGV